MPPAPPCPLAYEQADCIGNEAADPDAIVLADGTSCRHQIHDGAQREAVHVARLLADQLAPGTSSAASSP